MPDLDHLPRAVGRRWRQVEDAVVGRHGLVVVAERIEKAIAATLRYGGVKHACQLQYLHQLWDALGAKPADRPVAVRCVLDALPRSWVTGLGDCFVKEARRLAHGASESDGAGDDVGLAELVGSGLERMAWQQCFGPMEPRSVPGAFGSLSDYHDYVQSCLGLVRFGHFVDEAATRDDSSKIRAPRSREQRKSTKELLDVPV